MKRIIAAMTALIIIIAACPFSAFASNAESSELYAPVMNFDNNDTSMIHTNDGKVKFIREMVKRDGEEIKNYHVGITGDGYYSVQIDVTGINFYGHSFDRVVLVTDSDLTKLSVKVTDNAVTYEIASVYEEYNGHGCFKFSNPVQNPDSITISVLEENFSYSISRIFFCANAYSAEYVIDNNVLPSDSVKKVLEIQEIGNYTAINLGNLSDEDKNGLDGGLYCDFESSKWPTVAVDENDRIYIGASSCRREHIDPFGATVLVTSDDGGVTYSNPKQINNTINDDRDVGITYIGNGKMLATYFTGESYLPDGENYFLLKRDKSNENDADEWDSQGNPIGGINGTYESILQYIKNTDPTYNLSHCSYALKSNDYGETWNAEPYKLLKSEKYELTSAMEETACKYQLTKPGEPAPVTSPNGPAVLRDGSVLWVGKLLSRGVLAAGDIAAYVSNDCGDTWQYRGQVPIPFEYRRGDFNEPDTVETMDGVLVCTIRSFEVYTSFSYDKGATWTTPAEAQGHIKGLSHGISVMPNGDLLVTTGYRNHPRRIFAYVSEDGGRTWSEKAELTRNFPNGDDMGYPSSVCLSDGSIITSYYGTLSGEDHSSILTTKWKYTKHCTEGCHKITNEEIIQNPTCTVNGSIGGICSECNTVVMTQIIRAQGHKYANGVCSVCGSGQAKSFEKDSVVELGSYPQSLVKSSDLIENLNDIAAPWITENYFRYKDVEYNGEKYRAVCITKYRPRAYGLESNFADSFQYLHGYKLEQTYWFKYEPLKWKVIDPQNGLVICESIIDADYFYDDYYVNTKVRGGEACYANSYKHSNIRDFLTGDFYEMSFTDDDKKYIVPTEVICNDYTDLYSMGNCGFNDSVFLLSYTCASYADTVNPSDYAVCRGLGDDCPWWLSSAGVNKSNVCNVTKSAGVQPKGIDIRNTYVGIRPAMCLKYSASEFYCNRNFGHSFEATIIQKRDFEHDGKWRYVCSNCGYEYLTVLPKYVHSEPGDINGDGKVNAADSNMEGMIIRGLLNVDMRVEEAADINYDKKINIMDQILLTKKIIG